MTNLTLWGYGLQSPLKNTVKHDRAFQNVLFINAVVQGFVLVYEQLWIICLGAEVTEEGPSAQELRGCTPPTPSPHAVVID